MRMPAVESLRLRLRPDPMFEAAPLKHTTEGDGSEAISGTIAKGLDQSGLSVEQRGDTVLVRYSLNRTKGGHDLVGVQQQFRLGFQPEEKAAAHYDPATGSFEMAFPKP